MAWGVGRERREREQVRDGGSRQAGMQGGREYGQNVVTEEDNQADQRTMEEVDTVPG
ncbi:hypothetical protein ACJ73_08253, partial [Blastomyces percursus]